MASVPDQNTILNVIYEELEKVNIERVELSESTDITKDLQIDSLAVMDLVFALEEHFDVSVPINDLADTQTIGQLSQLVATLAARA